MKAFLVMKQGLVHHPLKNSLIDAGTAAWANFLYFSNIYYDGVSTPSPSHQTAVFLLCVMDALSLTTGVRQVELIRAGSVFPPLQGPMLLFLTSVQPVILAWCEKEHNSLCFVILLQVCTQLVNCRLSVALHTSCFSPFRPPLTYRRVVRGKIKQWSHFSWPDSTIQSV